jgi:hypothetical protein
METLTLDGELDRQLKAVRRGETESVVCPWHGNIVNAETGNCCIEMDEARERLAKEHFESIDRQFRGIRNHLRDSVQCRYCDGINRAENLDGPAHWKRPYVSPYCCPLMDAACATIGDRLRVQAQLDQKRRIEDGIAKASRN